MIRAQEWIKLAYAHTEVEFDRVVADLNDGQMISTRSSPMQRHPVQQQQAKAK